VRHRRAFHSRAQNRTESPTVGERLECALDQQDLQIAFIQAEDDG
jgi:hypothetical protein